MPEVTWANRQQPAPFYPPPPLQQMPFVPFTPAHLQQQQLNAGLAALVFAAQQAQVAPLMMVPPAHAAQLAAAAPGSPPPAGPSAGAAHQQSLAPQGAGPSPALAALAAFDGNPAAPLNLQTQVANVVRGHQQEMMQRHGNIERAARQQLATAVGGAARAVQVGLVHAGATTQNNVAPHLQEEDNEEQRRLEREGEERRSSSDQEER